MSFLDNTGLTYFYSKIKEKFIRSVNTMTPDSNGNVTITNVATADNLTSPDVQQSYGTFIYRTSGGDVSLESGQAELVSIKGNVDIQNRVAENFDITTENGIGIEITNKAMWRSQVVSSGTTTFTLANGTWTPALTSYGVTAYNVITSSINISVSGNISSATVNKTTWETNANVVATNTYYFNYNSNAWYLDSNAVDLATYGIVITGTPQQDDIITVEYIAATPNSTITINYTKASQGTITPATPSSFQATGFNQFDASTMYLNNYTITDHIITPDEGSVICYCRAVGGVTNGYVAYSNDTAVASILDIGWCATLPSNGSYIVQDNQDLTALPTNASIPFEEDGYVVVAATNKNNICIHPRWSGTHDEEFEAYVAPSTIALPTQGTINGSTYSLPSSMPAVGLVADEMDLDKKKYVKNIETISYSPSELERIRAMGVDYDYDNNHIYYVLTEPFVYDINVSSTYTVNDWGTEEFIGTTVPLTAQTLYGQNLRDKLRLDVEPKKFLVTNVQCSNWSQTNTYPDFPYRGSILINGVTSQDVPEVIFGLTEAISGDYAPIAETDNGKIYIYSTTNTTITIPTIIVWRATR